MKWAYNKDRKGLLTREHNEDTKVQIAQSKACGGLEHCQLFKARLDARLDGALSNLS